MGASEFWHYVQRGKAPGEGEWVQEGPYRVKKLTYRDWRNADEAFQLLADQSRFEDGHSYSGAIGMKSHARLFAKAKTREEADAIMCAALDRDGWHADKWCSDCPYIEIEEGEIQFIFFGLAPS